MNLSIIIPVYNVEKYLVDTLESILAQKITLFEVILVDDGSIDRSGKICDDYAKKNANVHVFHTVNRGVSNARNFGLAKAKGKYIHFVDSDDVLEDGMYLDFMRIVENYEPDVIECGCTKIFVKNKKEYISNNGTDANLQTKHEIADYLDGIKYEKKQCLLHYIWNKWYRRDILLENKIQFNNEVSLGEDFLFNCQVIQRIDSLHIIDKSYYHYFIRGGSLVSAFQPEPWKRRQLVLDAQKELYNNFEIWESNEKQIMYEEGRLCFSALRSINSKRCKLGRKDKILFLKQMSQTVQMEYAKFYLLSSKKKVHRIWLFLLNRFGIAGIKFVIFLDKIQKVLKG